MYRVEYVSILEVVKAHSITIMTVHLIADMAVSGVECGYSRRVPTGRAGFG